MKIEAAIYLNKNEYYLKQHKKITPFGLYVTYAIFADGQNNLFQNCWAKIAILCVVFS